MSVRTRFAPSPTGYLHIGGVRTALFNWLFARQHGGKFILRIDDTDEERNVEEALAPILHGLSWLGIDWDEGPQGGPHAPYYQSKRADRHAAAVAKLLDDGRAYKDYARTEEIQAERDAARQAGKTFVYSRRFMAETPADQKRFEADGRACVVRLKMPREGTLVLEDLVRGRVEFAWGNEQDHVIQRANGSCLYHLATVVDDEDFKISHVIRAEEHLSNTPRQLFIARSLGYEPTKFAHLPYVAQPGSKNKLSKRKIAKYLKNADFKKVYDHGAAIAQRVQLEIDEATFNPVIVDFYEQVGYLPEAIVNYLLLLGWALDDKTEFFTRDEMIEHFSLERVNKAPASFDPAKLLAFQEHYMNALDTKKKVAMCLPYLQKAKLMADPPPFDTGPYLSKIVDAADDRIKVAGDVLDYADFFTPDAELTYDEKAFEKWLRKPTDAAELLTSFKDSLAAVEPFDAPTLEQCLQAFVEARHIKTAAIIHAVRIAVTGKAVGFGLFETLALLGQKRCIDRIDLALTRLEIAS